MNDIREQIRRETSNFIFTASPNTYLVFRRDCEGVQTIWTLEGYNTENSLIGAAKNAVGRIAFEKRAEEIESWYNHEECAKTPGFKVLRAQVLVSPGPDTILLFTDLPSPFPPGISNDNLVIKFEATGGSGEEYVRKTFGVEVEVINTLGGKVERV